MLSKIIKQFFSLILQLLLIFNLHACAEASSAVSLLNNNSSVATTTHVPTAVSHIPHSSNKNKHTTIPDYGVCGANIKYKCRGTGGLTVSGTGKMHNYNHKNQPPWTAYKSLINYVVIEDGVTSIGENAFSGYATEVIFPPIKPKWFFQSPLIEVKFRYDSFAGCENLTFISIAETVTSIGKRAFQKCTGLTSLTIPKAVTYIGDSAFKDCSSLTSLTYFGKSNPGSNTVFQGCDKLKFVSVLEDYEGNNFCGKPVKRTLAAGTCGTSVEWLLDKTTGTLIISGTGEIDDYTFNKVPWFSYENLIKKIEIKEGVTSIGSKAFSKCTTLTSVIIPSSVTSIGKKAFCACSDLIDVTYFGKNEPTILTKDTFSGCDKLKEVHVPICYKSDKFGKMPVSFIDELSLVAIVKNEAPYIKEWIEYHKLVGVTKFYIYDNESTDNLAETLKDYIKSGEVVYNYFPGLRQQMNVYNEVLKTYKYKTKYIGFVDVDEFIVPVENKTVVEALEDIMEIDNKISGVGIDCLSYASAGLIKKPKGLVIENYKYRAEDSFYYNHQIKTICNPRNAIIMPNAHHLIYENGCYFADEEGNKLNDLDTNKLTYKKLRINHYFTKSKNEYKEKIARGDTIKAKTMADFFARDKNDIYDYIMEKYINQVKNKLKT